MPQVVVFISLRLNKCCAYPDFYHLIIYFYQGKANTSVPKMRRCTNKVTNAMSFSPFRVLLSTMSL